ncbi:unnamed protein product [Calicophoron daubneyi]|uniref:Zinc finger protein 395 n=1 Tax=Calicophoron daubneyi TaxID=300641 RepID=A0AAV2TU26_CALDB
MPELNMFTVRPDDGGLTRIVTRGIEDIIPVNSEHPLPLPPTEDEFESEASARETASPEVSQQLISGYQGCIAPLTSLSSPLYIDAGEGFPLRTSAEEGPSGGPAPSYSGLQSTSPISFTLSPTLGPLEIGESVGQRSFEESSEISPPLTRISEFSPVHRSVPVAFPTTSTPTCWTAAAPRARVPGGMGSSVQSHIPGSSSYRTHAEPQSISSERFFASYGERMPAPEQSRVTSESSSLQPNTNVVNSAVRSLLNLISSLTSSSRQLSATKSTQDAVSNALNHAVKLLAALTPSEQSSSASSSPSRSATFRLTSPPRTPTVASCAEPVDALTAALVSSPVYVFVPSCTSTEVVSLCESCSPSTPITTSTRPTYEAGQQHLSPTKSLLAVRSPQEKAYQPKQTYREHSPIHSSSDEPFTTMIPVGSFSSAEGGERSSSQVFSSASQSSFSFSPHEEGLPFCSEPSSLHEESRTSTVGLTIQTEQNPASVSALPQFSPPSASISALALQLSPTLRAFRQLCSQEKDPLSVYIADLLEKLNSLLVALSGEGTHLASPSSAVPEPYTSPLPHLPVASTWPPYSEGISFGRFGPPSSPKRTTAGVLESPPTYTSPETGGPYVPSCTCVRTTGDIVDVYGLGQTSTSTVHAEQTSRYGGTERKSFVAESRGPSSSTGLIKTMHDISALQGLTGVVKTVTPTGTVHHQQQSLIPGDQRVVVTKQDSTKPPVTNPETIRRSSQQKNRARYASTTAHPSTSLSTLSSAGMTGRSEVKKCRKVYGIEHRERWCNQCRWKKACRRFPDLPPTSTSASPEASTRSADPSMLAESIMFGSPAPSTSDQRTGSVVRGRGLLITSPSGSGSLWTSITCSSSAPSSLTLPSDVSALPVTTSEPSTHPVGGTEEIEEESMAASSEGSL